MNFQELQNKIGPQVEADMATCAVVVTCPQCRFEQGVQDAELDKVISGALGAVCCPRCSRPLNEEIKTASEKK
jgi:hypothetical protein